MQSESPFLSSCPLRALSHLVSAAVPTSFPTADRLISISAFALYHCVLALRVSMARQNTETWIGGSSKSAAASGEKDTVQLSTRCHGNYTENVPMALLLGAIVEMNGGNRRTLTGGFAALLVARILHVELGLRAENALGMGRVVGHLTTLAFITSMGGYAAWLVRGYWGF